MTDLLTNFPQSISPSNEELLRLISNSGHIDEAAEIVLDDQADAGVCCQHFIDFFENHLIPHIHRNQSAEERESKVAPFSKFIEEMNDTNCDVFFKSKAMLEFKSLLENNVGNWKAVADSRLVNSGPWMLQEFERCLRGEDFDFTDYTTE